MCRNFAPRNIRVAKLWHKFIITTMSMSAVHKNMNITIMSIIMSTTTREA